MFIVDIEFSTDISILKYRNEATCTIIIRNDRTGFFESLDTFWGLKIPSFSDPRTAMLAAIKRAQNFYHRGKTFSPVSFRGRFDKFLSQYPEHDKILKFIYRDGQDYDPFDTATRKTHRVGQSGRTPWSKSGKRHMRTGKGHVVKQTIQW